MKRTSKHAVILGGGYAGMIAAARLAMRRSHDRITLVDPKPAFVQRIRLHELLAGGQPKQIPYQSALASRGVTFRQATVEQIDPPRQQVRLAGAIGDARLDYDTLIIALGGRTATQFPGVAAHAIALNDGATIATASQQLQQLATEGGRVLIVGGGLSGIETVTELAERLPGLHLTLVTSSRFGEAFSPPGERYLRRTMDRLRVEVLDRSSVIALEPGRARLTTGTVPFDQAIWCAGFEAPRLLRDSGLAVDALGRAIVDETLQAPGFPNVFIAGDAASFEIGSERLRESCARALPMGATAAENAARLLTGTTMAPFRLGFLVWCVSLGRRDGLIQLTNREDRPVDRIITGRAGALVKEAICRMTYEVIRVELRFARRLYRWPESVWRTQTNPVPSAASAGM